MARYAMESFPVGAFQCNCTLLINESARQCIVVDPGDEAELILQRVDAHKVRVSALWHTHAHLDHVGATKRLYEECARRNAEAGAPPPAIYLHEGDRFLYENVAMQSQLLGLPAFEVRKEFTGIKNGQTYDGFADVKALFTPGHTPGSCCLEVGGGSDLYYPKPFHVPGADQVPAKVLISGDTLFRRSIGRTDLWGGNTQQILQSIKTKLLTLPEDCVVIPGHGPLTTIAAEAAKNPFLQ